ncbi:MAG: hypothetical protein JO219_05175 [Candidatus Eremiobacteraeota bacterium]|nr:hypothetical protein [Candidatus Eremiobacteraeota bacterium]MBV8367180.1 hypothetical protein [Candidatus Eremiobacteraeota bacterium]
MKAKASVVCLIALVLIASAAARASAAQAMLEDGAAVPAVPALQSVFDGNDTPFDLKQASAGTTLVLYFFPQAFTSD